MTSSNPTPAEVLTSSLAKDIQSLVLSTLGYTPEMIAGIWNNDADGREPFLQLATKHVAAAELALAPDTEAINWDLHEAAMRRANHGRAHNLETLHGVLLQQAQKAFGRPDTTDEKMRMGD